MSSVEIGVVLGWMFAQANGFGPRAPWGAETIGAAVAAGMLLFGGLVVLSHWSDRTPRSVPGRRARGRGRDASTAAIVKVCFRSWARLGRWAEDLERTLATLFPA